MSQKPIITTTSAQELQKINQNYISKYQNKSDPEIVKLFISDLRKFLDFTMEEDGVLHDPTQYLINKAQIGFCWVYVYQGYVPTEKIEILRKPIINYLIKYFDLDTFNGFHLEFKSYPHHFLTTIKLQWNRPPENPITNSRNKPLTPTSSTTHRRRRHSRSEKLATQVTEAFRNDLAIHTKEVKAEIKKNVKSLSQAVSPQRSPNHSEEEDSEDTNEMIDVS